MEGESKDERYMPMLDISDSFCSLLFDTCSGQR